MINLSIENKIIIIKQFEKVLFCYISKKRFKKIKKCWPTDKFTEKKKNHELEKKKRKKG